jgi:peroxiredoxin
VLKTLGTLVALTLTSVATLAVPATLRAAGQAGEQAADFPPGLFSDGGQYSLADFEGKVVVLFFYEKDCPGCRGKIPERNAVVKQFEGKPVRFFAIAAGDTFQQAKAYGSGTRLAMPVFADPMSLMEARYGQTISLQNIYQFRVIGPDGKIVGYQMNAADIEKALAGVKPKHDPEQYHAKVRPAVELFEWNQHAAGNKALKKLLTNKDKEVAESAAKLQEVVKAEVAQWAEDAGTAADGEPVKAYDLYAKVAAALPKDDELSKKAAEAMKTLKTNKDVKAELDARKQYVKMLAAMGAAQPSQRAEVARFAAGIAKKYPDAPTGKKAAELAEELAKQVATRS